MKTSHIFLTAALMIAALGCGGSKEADGVITMITGAREVNFKLYGSGTAIINWGDGSETVELQFFGEIDDVPLPTGHTYSDATLRKITITGDNITGLDCARNGLTALDVSRNTALTQLYCDNNQLTALDVSRNTELTGLRCNKNQLTALDVSSNTALTQLACAGNQLTALDVSGNTALTVLYCYDNQITALDVSANIALEYLYCYDNRLTTLDAGNNTALFDFAIDDNLFTVEALNDLFASLHDIDLGVGKRLHITNNPGTADCDPRIAVAKGWQVAGYEGSLSLIPAVETDAIELDKLRKTGDVYYFNDVLFTGNVIKEKKSNSYWEEKTETWEMKDGKFHGKYSERAWESGIDGHYKDGKKDGEWKIWESAMLEIQYYVDGKRHGEWKYFDHSEGDEAYKIEIYENDVLIIIGR